MTVDPTALSAIELRERYRSRELSPVEVVEATLRRIERLEPSLGAFVTVTAELALGQARAAEAAVARGDDRPLLGVPVSVKDLAPTKGVRTTRGSLLYADWVPDFDAPAVERVYAAGGILIGKTNTPELGWKGDSGNRVVGPTHNPWRHGLTAGGSSGGAAAAVAAGLGPLALGTDGAGSIRIPAAFCGVVGLKPSFGLVPYYPASAVELLSHAGPIARTVPDAALFLDVLAGADARDRYTAWAPGLDTLASLDAGVRGLRVAWSPDLGFARVDPEVAQLAAAGAAVFADELGCALVEADPPLDDPRGAVATIWRAGMAALFPDLDAVRDRLDPGFVEVVESAAALTGADVARAIAARTQAYERLRLFMADHDLLLTPTLPLTAFAAGADRPPDGPTDLLAWTPFTYPFNLSGQPAATVPCGLTPDGLPVGLQIVGRPGADALVLRAAAAFERARPWPRPPLGSA
jgi:aspartyl-tRNA(Asn)/glutamyl-tRNA(Gln) amidotransferase subunit A